MKRMLPGGVTALIAVILWGLLGWSLLSGHVRDFDPGSNRTEVIEQATAPERFRSQIVENGFYAMFMSTISIILFIRPPDLDPR